MVAGLLGTNLRSLPSNARQMLQKLRPDPCSPQVWLCATTPLLLWDMLARADVAAYMLPYRLQVLEPQRGIIILLSIISTGGGSHP